VSGDYAIEPSESQFFNLGRIKQWSPEMLRKDRRRKSCTLAQAAAHNLRQIAAERQKVTIDQSKSHLNRVLHGPSTAIQVDQLADELMQAAGINVATLRKDTVWAVEALISLPLGSAVDESVFFQRAFEWTRGHFGVPVLSAVVHADERAFHAHVLLLPLIGGKLDARTLIGDRVKVRATITAFNREVASKFGLTLSEPRRKKTKIDDERRRKITGNLLRRFRADPRGEYEHVLIEAIRSAVSSGLEGILDALGVELTDRSFDEIARQTDRPSAMRKMPPYSTRPKSIECLPV